MNEAKTVLIIEDEDEIRNFAARVLELEGYQVLEVESSEEGLKLVREDGVALVLLDLRLSGRSGWTVLKELKNDSELSSIPIIVFTASAGVQQQERALRMGAADYLVKPISAARLKRTVNRALRQKRKS